MRAYAFSMGLILGLFTLLGACEGPPEQPRSTPPSVEVADTLVNRNAGFRVKTGADQLVSEALFKLEGKQVALVANHTSMVGDRHLVDTLLALGVNLVKVFSPEHGFRGTADAGQRVRDSRDPETGLPIVSLYGSNKKPTPDQLADVDVVLFDIQDVGTRFYTYLSTLAYVLEACAEQQKLLLVLDRPNPNGWYVDGPVLQPQNASFIGLHQIPIVHGMTLGEYAQLIAGERWLGDSLDATPYLQVEACVGYRHDMRWKTTGLPWIAPSPNLASEYAAYLYPALCWLEPTPVSVGRGTDSAFTLVGAPWYGPAANARQGEQWSAHGLEATYHEFTPRSLPGKATHPKFQDETCQGLDFQNRVDGQSLFLAGLTLLADLYRVHAQQRPGERFFQKGFERWPGTRDLQRQIEAGTSPQEIYQSWQEEVEAFKAIRQAYLLYPGQ